MKMTLLFNSELHLAAISALILAMAGCSVHRPLEPDNVKPDIPEQFSTSGTIKAADKWWQEFSSSELTTLIETALADNLDVQQAWAKLRQAESTLHAAGANKLPSVTADGSASRTEYVSGDLTDRSSYSTTLSASYEVDLWKKISSTEKASYFDYQATRKDVESTALALTSMIAETWFSLVEQNMLMELQQEQVETNEYYLKLVELRFRKGDATAMEVFQQRLQLSSSTGALPSIKAQIAILERTLSVLLGRPPEKLNMTIPDTLPQLSELPQTGLCVDLISKRPDIAAEEYRLLAADQRFAVAQASLYPTFSISASTGGQVDNLSDMVDNWFVNLAGNLFAPLFDGGTRRAEVSRTESVVQQYLLGWKQMIYNALLEVEEALISEAGQEQTLVEIRKQIELAEHTLKRAESNYVNGTSSFLNVLSSIESLQSLQKSEVDAMAQLLLSRIDLYVALGGNWTEALTPAQQVVNK